MATAKLNGAGKKVNGVPAKREAIKTKTAPAVLSEEQVVDSSSDAETSSESEVDEHDERTTQLVAEQAKAVQNGKTASKAAEPEESSEEDSSSSDEDEDRTQTPTPAKVAPPSEVNGVKRKSSSSEEDTSDSEDDSDHKNKKAKLVTKDTPSQSAAPAQARPFQAVPVQPYVPPAGFKQASIRGEGALAAADLKGKVVWHISAPRNVPLTALKNISQSAIDSGKPVLKHDGIDYVLVEAEQVESALLLPTDDGYKSAGRPISKSYILRPAFTLPAIPAIAASRNAGSAIAANIATAAVTAIRPQPKGLKMRYKPPGFGSGKAGRIGDSSDDEDDDDNNNEDDIYQFPKAVGPSTDGNGTMLGDGVAKKQKKDKKSKHNMVSGITPGHETQPAPSAMPATSIDKDEARRKAEKKAKKAAKRKAQEQA